METRWRAIGETVALSAVVISVLLLTWEVSQANRLAETTVQQEINQQFNEFNLAVASDPGLAEFMATLSQEGNPELTKIEHERALGLGIWQRNAWMSTSIAYSKGLVSERSHQSMLKDIRWVAENYPVLKPYLRLGAETYSGEWESEVDKVILEVTSQ